MKLTEPAMRPPQEVRSLILQTTQGCTWGKCNYCYTSRGYQFGALETDEFEQEARALKRYFAPDTSIYLAGANPFALPAKKLLEYIGILRKYYPEFRRVSMQSRIDDISRKSDAELRELCEAGLSHLYIGTENGYEPALTLMDKGHTAQDTRRELKRLREAGFTYTNFYILGMAGKGHGQESARATAAMFNEVRPERVTTTGMTLFEKAPVAQMAKTGEFVPASEREMIEELRTFLQELEGDIFYDGVHYLNALNYRFNVGDPDAKAKVLADIDEVLATYSDEELELMVNRKQKLSL